MSKNVMATLCGRPNVGKSTLINSLVGEKIAIVSSKPQTTRNRIIGIVNQGETQYVFLDTPGFIKPRNKLGDYMVNVVNESIADVDCIVFIVEPKEDIGPGEIALINNFSDVPVILAINKIDTIEKEKLLGVIKSYTDAYDFSAVIPISAKFSDGTDILLDEISKYAVEGHHLFDDDMITDQPERQICAEFVREKILLNCNKEIPHGIAVEITKFNERDDGLIEIDATIYCEKSTHKGILIGKNGSMIRSIGEQARSDMENFLGTKVFLQTWVKVKDNWRESEMMIKNFGYYLE